MPLQSGNTVNALIFKMIESKAIQLLQIQDDNRVFVDMPDDEDNPCLACGACCHHFRVSMYMGENGGFAGRNGAR